MNREQKPTQKPVILEGEIIAPGPAREHQGEGRQGHPHIRVVKMGWFGKAVLGLAMLAIFAATIVLAAGAVLVLLPVVILAALWTWWRVR